VILKTAILPISACVMKLPVENGPSVLTPDGVVKLLDLRRLFCPPASRTGCRHKKTSPVACCPGFAPGTALATQPLTVAVKVLFQMRKVKPGCSYLATRGLRRSSSEKLSRKITGL
jgi:hypothetical protein